MARLTCVLTVAGLTTSCPAISSFDKPSATSAITPRSRSVSPPRSGLARGGRTRGANSAISRRVTPGDSNASPRATARTPATSSAGSVSFTRKPLAPIRSASKTYSSKSNVVSMITRRPFSRSLDKISRAAARPSHRGIRISISSTSGTSCAASACASSPSAASPTTSMSASASSNARKPARTSAWSSASSTRIIATSTPHGCRRTHRITAGAPAATTATPSRHGTSTERVDRPTHHLIAPPPACGAHQPAAAAPPAAAHICHTLILAPSLLNSSVSQTPQSHHDPGGFPERNVATRLIEYMFAYWVW